MMPLGHEPPPNKYERSLASNRWSVTTAKVERVNDQLRKSSETDALGHYARWSGSVRFPGVRSWRRPWRSAQPGTHLDRPNAGSPTSLPLTGSSGVGHAGDVPGRSFWLNWTMTPAVIAGGSGRWQVLSLLTAARHPARSRQALPCGGFSGGVYGLMTLGPPIHSGRRVNPRCLEDGMEGWVGAARNGPGAGHHPRANKAARLLDQDRRQFGASTGASGWPVD